jgi:cytochrome d ubiquinol oxidase subunit I
MILAAFMVAGYSIAAVYAVALLRGRRDTYHRVGFLMPFTLAAIVTPVQVFVGDWAARFVAEHEPVKLAAMEGLYRTESGVPLHIAGIYVDNEMRYSLDVPRLLSLLAYWDPNATVMGLAEVPPADRPPVNAVHWGFQIMVAIGTLLLLLALWLALAWWRRRDLPRSRWFLVGAVAAGPAAAVAMEAGWTVTEVGRQPWTVYGVLRTADAVNPAPGLVWGFALVTAVYVVLTVVTVYMMRRLARNVPVPIAPQERDVEEYKVV